MFDNIKTAQEAYDLLADVVKDVGADHEYPFEQNEVEVEGAGHVTTDCQYAFENEDDTLTPGCIIGYAAYKTGDLKTLHENYENNNIAGILGYSGPVARVFAAAQAEQDKGRNWGDALAAAKQEADYFEQAF